MKYPAEPSTIEIVIKCLNSLLKKAREKDVKSMVIPAPCYSEWVKFRKRM